MKRKKLVRGLALLLAALLTLGIAVMPLSAMAAAGDNSQEVTTGGDVGLEGLVGSGNMAVITVVDAGGTAVAGAEVSLSTVGYRATTNEKGAAVFDRLTLSQTYTVAVGGYDKVEPNSFAPAGPLVYLTVKATKNGGGGTGGGTGGDPKPTPPPTPTPTVTPTPSVSPAPTVSPAPSPTDSVPPGPTAEPTATPPPGTPPTPAPVRPTAKPSPGPGASEPPSPAPAPTPGGASPSPGVPEVIPRPTPPVLVVTPEDRVIIPEKDVESSVTEDREVHITFEDADGNITDEVTLRPFDRHDEELVKDTEVWVERREDDRPVIQLVKESGELMTDASIPHNIIQASRDRQADVRVTFQRPGGGSYDFDALFPCAFFEPALFDDQDITMEYDPEAAQGWLIFSNQAEVHGEKPLIAPAAAYEKAAENGWGIKVRVYNPEKSADLWYEWAFQPEDLKKVASSLTDTDLFISPNRPALSLLDGLDTRKNNVQYLNIAYHGQLPAPASLRVKNMAGFRQGDEVALVYCNEQAGELQTLLIGLALGDDGYLTYGVEHCSVYVLTAPKPPVSVWYYVLGGALLLVLCVLIIMFLLLGRKLMDELAWQVLARLDAWSKNGRSAEEEELAAWIAAELVAQEVKADRCSVRKRLKKLLHKGYACKGENGLVITPEGEKRLTEHRGTPHKEMVNHEQNK